VKNIFFISNFVHMTEKRRFVTTLSQVYTGL